MTENELYRLGPKRKRRKFSNADIALAMEMLENCVPIDVICLKVGCSTTGLLKWQRRFDGMTENEIAAVRGFGRNNGDTIVRAVAIPVYQSAHDRYYRLTQIIKTIRDETDNTRLKKMSQMARETIDKLMDDVEAQLRERGYRLEDFNRRAG